MELYVGSSSFYGCYLCITLSMNAGYRKTFYLNPKTGFWEETCSDCWFKESQKNEIVAKFAINLLNIKGV